MPKAKNSSTEFQEEGNTNSSSCPRKKQVSPALRWVFVLNNYTEQDISSIVPVLTKNCIFACFHKEIGDISNTPHLQGYIEFHKKCKQRPMSLGLTKRIHWGDKDGKCCNGDRESNVHYISKQCDYDPQKIFWRHGFPEIIEVMETLYPWQQACLDIYLQEPSKREIHWFWSKEGNTGKTEMVRFLQVKYGVPFSYGGAVGDIMNLAFNNMKGCKAFVFCLTRSKKNKISYDALEQLKDGLISNNKFETGCFAINRPHVFVFANEPPEEDEDEHFLTNDRLVLHSI